MGNKISKDNLEKISKEDVIEAISRWNNDILIRDEFSSRKHESKDYHLFYQGEHYNSKVIFAIAYEIHSKVKIGTEQLSGGVGPNGVATHLIKLGFDVCILGSPGWFNLQSNNQNVLTEAYEVEELRLGFLNSFSPEKISKMSGEELLNKIFGSGKSMMRILREDSDYSRFGSLGNQGALGFVYKIDNTWKYNESRKAEVLTYNEAIDKAKDVTKELLNGPKTYEQYH